MLFNGKFYNKPGHLGMTTEELKDALDALPKPEAGDAGKAVVVNADADGYELGEAGGGGGDVYANVISLTSSGFPAWKFIIYTSTQLTVGSMTNADFAALLTDLGASSSKPFPVNAVSYKFTGTTLEQEVLSAITPTGSIPLLYGYSLYLNSSGPTITHDNYDGLIYPSAISIVSSTKL